MKPIVQWSYLLLLQAAMNTTMAWTMAVPNPGPPSPPNGTCLQKQAMTRGSSCSAQISCAAADRELLFLSISTATMSLPHIGTDTRTWCELFWSDGLLSSHKDQAHEAEPLPSCNTASWLLGRCQACLHDAWMLVTRFVLCSLCDTRMQEENVVSVTVVLHAVQLLTKALMMYKTPLGVQGGR